MAEQNQVSNTKSSGANERPVLPAVDIFEDAGGITLLADLPGVTKERLEIKVDGDRVGRFVHDITGGQSDIEAVTPIARMTDLDGVGARLAGHHVVHDSRMAAHDARPQQQKRAGSMRVVGVTQVKIEIEGLGQLFRLMELETSESKSGKIRAERFLQLLVNVF